MGKMQKQIELEYLYEKILLEIYQENRSNFRRTIEDFIEIFTVKVDKIYLENKIIYFTDKQIPHDKLRDVIKITSWDSNVKSISKHTFEIINPEKILPSDQVPNVGNEIYLIEDLVLFEEKYQYYFENTIQ
jgi:hypothetical protein